MSITSAEPLRTVELLDLRTPLSQLCQSTEQGGLWSARRAEPESLPGRRGYALDLGVADNPQNQNPMRPVYVRRWTTLSCDGIGVAVGGDVVAVAVVAVMLRCHAACKPDRGSVQSKCQSHRDGGALGAPHGSFDGPGGRRRATIPPLLSLA